MTLTPSILAAGVLALGIAAQWLAWRFRLPAIVLLLAFGVALGQWAPVDRSAGDQDFFFAMVSLSVGIILFEGGLSLDFREIRGAGGVVMRLVTVGLTITWLMTAGLARWVADFSWPMALLLGALLTVSGPTVVLPLLRHVQPIRRVGSLAKWEGIVNDPIGAVLAALVFEVVSQYGLHAGAAGSSLRDLGATMVVGGVLGGLGAVFLLVMLHRFWAPDYLQNPVILAFVMLIFAISNAIQHESGLVTVTIMGVILANQRGVAIRHVVEFKENLAVLLISTLFIVLTRRLQIDRDSLAQMGWSSVALAALLIVVVRPLAVFGSTFGSGLAWREKAFLAWIHPRGIVAAAVSSVFALRLLEQRGADDPLVAEAGRLELTVFLVIAATVVVYGMTLAPLARRLGLSGENPQGILLAGASRAAREIGMAIKNEGFPVLVVDTNHRNIAAARMAGLAAKYASVGSEYVQEEIDLGGIGRILAMTPNDEVNTLAAMGFAERFGRAEVYQLAASESSSDRTERVAAYRRGRILFDRPTTYRELEQRFAEGYTIKKTLMSEDFTFDSFRARYGSSALILFRIDESRQLIVATAEKDAMPKPGQKLIALVREEAEGAAAKSEQRSEKSS